MSESEGRPLRAACIGCGGRGRLYSALARSVPGLEMVGYVDERPEAAESALAEYGGRFASTDPGRALEDPDVDLVMICTWHDSHRPLGIAAARAGKHILIEKPLALTVEDARAIEDAVAGAGVKLIVGHKLRWAPVVREVARRIPSPRVLVGQVMDDRWADDAWYSRPNTGGGNVMSQGCHIVDLIHGLAGADPVWVAAAGGAVTHPGSPQLDQAIATVRYANGAVASLILGDAGVNPVSSKFFAELWDDRGRGACLYDRCRRAALWGAADASISAGELSPESRDDPEGDRELLCALVRAIREETAPLPGAREGRITVQTLAAIVESARTGQPRILDPA